MGKYVLSIDQSTQGTKALLFDEKGDMAGRYDLPHEQIVNALGWVAHDPEEIYQNVLRSVKAVVEKSGISKDEIIGVGISNQRETALAWEIDGKAIDNAIVWQCARGETICNRIQKDGYDKLIQERTGLQLSPYFSAGKIAWILENVEGARAKADASQLLYGTIDSFLVYRLTGGKSFKTDYSNASRTQLFNIKELKWDQEICGIFGIPEKNLPEVHDSNGYYGETDFAGFLDEAIPIHGVLGDSHGAMFAQGCFKKGMIKTTYGTGSSVMMNVGEEPVFSQNGVVTSLAWGMDGKVNYVLEGNVNYTGAVITWLCKDLKLINSANDTEGLARAASREDDTYLVPAFTGLGAPYWDSKATGMLSGMTRTTGQAEVVRAALDCIAYQIADVVKVMGEDSGIPIQEMRVDGGPTKNKYLMEFQSDILNLPVQVPGGEELSGIGAAYAAGISLGLYDKDELFGRIERTRFEPKMPEEMWKKKIDGWKNAVRLVLTK